MSRDTRDKLDQLLTHVGRNRRAMLKKLLIGAGALALVAPASSVIHAQDDDPAGRGKAKGKKGGKNGKGKDPGKGRGKGPDPTQGERGRGKGRA